MVVDTTNAPENGLEPVVLLENMLIEALEIKNILELSEVEGVLAIKSTYPIIKSLLEKNYILVAEQVSKKYTPKIEKYLQLPEGSTEQEIHKTFDALERAPKQLEAFMIFMQLLGQKKEPISKKKVILEAGSNSNTIKQLVDKKIIVIN